VVGAASETTPHEAKAASSEFLRPERQGNGLDSFHFAITPDHAATRCRRPLDTRPASVPIGN
jgi:hypothetical protein